jgi:hypothetical protein
MPIQCTCQHCGKAFLAKAYRVRNGQSRFCSLACYHTPRPGIFQDDGTVLVPLTQGKFAVIDAEDAKRVLAFNWTAFYSDGVWYAARNDDGSSVLMHRFVLGSECPDLVDHADRDGLNNRKRNLRPATPQESVMNRGRGRGNTSGYKGVFFHRHSGRWHACITKGRKAISLRYHTTPEGAARAYDKACRELFGDFCVPNFPDH